MKLTLQTDYALRILIVLARNPARLHSVELISDEFKISKNHLMKTAQALAKKGYVETVRGRNGGLKLAIAANKINVGAVVRSMEPNLQIAECFQLNPTDPVCTLLPNCRLKPILGEALSAFLFVLDQKNIADLVINQRHSNAT